MNTLISMYLNHKKVGLFHCSPNLRLGAIKQRVSGYMELLKIFIIAITLTGCAHTFSEEDSGGIPEFKSLVGSGSLYKTGASIENKKIEATLSLNNDYVVTGLQDRKALSLVTSEGPVLNLAICGENKEYIFCGRSIAE